jgi:PilZ domain
LTYLTLDDTNGGIIRNLSQGGIGVQVVAPLRPRQQLRVRFELRYPRLRVETRGEVVWGTFSGECGIRFLDLSPQMSRQISEWIFGDLLEGISLHSDPPGAMFAVQTFRPQKTSRLSEDGIPIPPSEEEDGLIVSATPVKVIELPARREAKIPAVAVQDDSQTLARAMSQTDWLSQPLSGRGLAWTVHTLMVVAGMLLFALVFLAITGEAPRWPLLMGGGVACTVAGLYWIFFQIFGGASLGARLARMAGYAQDEDEDGGPRFR